MKKFSFLLAMMLVLAFASSAFAAQATFTVDGDVYYKATPKVFDPTGNTTNYPYEIYLPNEQNPENYRIHSNYTKNTDACAACHATHTAVGNSLLQWYTVYDTCMACHDGTVTTTYDVQGGFVGPAANDVATFGGHFGTGAEGSLSNHNVTGAMEIAAAPGGSVVADTVDLEGDTNKQKTRWIAEFGCQSCHTPHGQGGNARILHPDANFAATAARGTGDYFVDVAGYVYKDAGFTKPALILKGYPYSPGVYAGATKITEATIDNSTGVSKVVYGDLGVVTKVTGTAALQVKMDIDNYLQTNESVEHLAGMNGFCGACHTDYNTEGYVDPETLEENSGSASAETGTYSKAHRHQVGFDAGHFQISSANMVKEDGKMECLTCHVAHGASQDYWTRTIGSGGTAYLADAALVEIAGSSALKRVPNMGTCEACHGKAKGNEGYNANSGQDGFANGAATTLDALAMPSTYNFDARTADYATADKGWVGNAKCTACHKDYVDGWKETKHADSSHTGATSCGRCHNPGNSIMGNTGTFATALAGDPNNDAGITCESCHGTGARHIAAPSAKNIFNPGKTSIERQVIECGRCHDMYNNSLADSYGLSTVSGMSYGAVAKLKTTDIVSRANWSVAFRVYDDNPAQFANARQLNTTSTHFGGAWGYANSKHFLGTGTAEAPNGVVTCTTCHDMHNGDIEGATKLEYNQLCASCHDVTASLVQAAAMPTNAWGRHQLELRDFAHSFKFGAPATIAAADIDFVNLEQAPSDTGLTPIVTSLADVFDGTNQTTKNNSLWRGATSAGAVGPKVKVYSDAGKTTQVYNNYDGTWELVAHPAGTVEGVDFHFEPTGAFEFENNVTTYNTGKLAGTYTVKWTSKANPTLTVTKSFTVTH